MAMVLLVQPQIEFKDIKFVEHPKDLRFVDITGIRFNRLVAIGYTGKNKRGRLQWAFKCDCGNIIIARTSNVKSGHTSSCGCYRDEQIMKGITKHGHSFVGKVSTEYRIWAGIKNRCSNPSNQAYSYYGNRGIAMFQPWADSFEAFFAYIGKRPGKEYSIDRINNSIGYFPGNIKWSTAKEQARNTRKNRLFTHNGLTKTLSEWAEISGISRSTITYRLARKWCINCALTLPKSTDFSGNACVHRYASK